MKEKYQFLRNENSIFISTIFILFGIGLLGIGLLGTTTFCLAQGDTWTKKKAMPTARTGLTASVVDGKIYAIGGCATDGGQNLGTVEVYDPVTDIWTSKTAMPTPRRLHCAAVVNGIIYVIGSDATWRKVEAYEPVTDTWTTKTPMPTGRGGLSCAVMNGKIYVMGGTKSPDWTPLKTVEEYDPATDTWATKADMHIGRYCFAASAVDGIIYVIGGQGASDQLSTVEAYDPATDTWTQKGGKMLAGRADQAACTVNEIIYVIGGFKGMPGSGITLSTVEAYDPVTDTFSEMMPMPNARMQPGIGAVNGKIYVIGGCPTYPNGPGLKIVEEYTPPITSLVQIDWQRHPQNPVLDVGSSGSWDAKEVRNPAVIFDGSSYHCWYSGWDGASDWHIMIGYASSPNGLTWTKHPTPVLDKGPSGKFDGAAVLGCCVIQVGDTLKMWYQGWSGGFLDNRIGYATSTDGTNWTKHSGNPVLEGGGAGSWNSYGAFFPSVIFDGVTYHIWYAGTAPGNQPWEIGYATSPDGITWTEHPDNPVLHAGSAGSWEEGVTFPTVLFDRTTFHMWYTGVNADYTGRIGYADSPDGINWTKADSLNPVLDLVPGTWEQNGIELGSVLFDQTDSTYKMWYSGLEGEIWRIGYASSATSPVSVNEKTTELKLPIEFALEPNYPNPFNPETSIRYSVSKPARVILRVMNLLGQEVCTLVNEDKPAGIYEVTWDGKDDHGQRVASGVYLYRLESKDFVQTRKMILLQ